MSKQQRIEFELNGSEFCKMMLKIRYVEAKKILLLSHKNVLMAGCQEPEGIAWLNLNVNVKHKFDPISIDTGNFLSICKHRGQLAFSGDTKLDAIAINQNFSAKNIPIDNWQPTIEHLSLNTKPITPQYEKLLEILRPALQLALELDSTVKIVQVMRDDRRIVITSLADTGALGYIGVWNFNNKWANYFDSIEFKEWTLPILAVKAFLDDDAAVLKVKNTKIIVYGTNYHIIFSQFGEARPVSIFTDLLSRKPLVKLDLDFKILSELLTKMPSCKTLRLAIESPKNLLLEGVGFAKIAVHLVVSQQFGGLEEITVNHKSFKHIINMAKMFNGTLQFGNSIMVNCESGNFEHHWLLGKAYSGE
jgi:hypothetical protein